MDVIGLLPVLAAGFAVPQFLPQILKLRRTDDTAGLSTTWAVITGLNNGFWFGYFAASRYWLALVPSSSATLLGGALGIMLNQRSPLAQRNRVLVTLWAGALAIAAAIDRRLLGALLTGAFLIQVVPAVAAAYRTRRPTGIARGTWLLILAEVSCWAVFGLAKGDGPLVVLGTTGIVSALLMLNRARTRMVLAHAGEGSGSTIGSATARGLPTAARDSDRVRLQRRRREGELGRRFRG